MKLSHLCIVAGARNPGLVKLISSLAVASALYLPASGMAEEYPSRPIRMVLPIPAGNSTDLLVRAIVDKMRERTGWTIVPDNRTGADFAPGILATTTAPADGHTVLFGFMSFDILPHMRKNLAWKLSDLAPVARIASSPSMIAVNSSVPAQTLAELVAWSKANPGKLSYGGPPLGSTGHLGAEMIRMGTGLNFVYVPYKSATLTIPDLVGGRTQVAYSSVVDLLEHIKTGKLRALMVLGPKRNPLLPDVPTAVELTRDPDMDIASWYGFFVRTGTARAIIDRLEREIIGASQTKEVIDYMVKTSQEPLSPMEGPEEFAKRIEADSRRWKNVIKQANIPVN